jgi:hypothetical protein
MGRPPKAKKLAVPARNMSWEEAIQHVLASAGGALHYTDIAEQIQSDRLRNAVGATPAQTVASHLSTSLRGEDSPFLRVGKGVYTLKAVTEEDARTPSDESKSAEQATESGALRAFGMFWQRDLVLWSGSQLLGRQGAGASDVNFAGQVGVYLLHDRERVIYIGRANDTLFARLKVHTVDRMASRWDRFSWFGIRSVNTNGILSDAEVPWTHEVVVETMEAVLIESLEPPLNRRRGDNFSGIEYIQATDPQIEAKKKKALLDEIMKAVER